MGSFGINTHAHSDAALFSIVLTLLTYIVKWVFGFHFPSTVYFLPTFIAIFLGFYLVLFVVFFILWNRG